VDRRGRSGGSPLFPLPARRKDSLIDGAARCGLARTGLAVAKSSPFPLDCFPSRRQDSFGRTPPSRPRKRNFCVGVRLFPICFPAAGLPAGPVAGQFPRRHRTRDRTTKW
jgi:hypothetical protein